MINNIPFTIQELGSVSEGKQTERTETYVTTANPEGDASQFLNCFGYSYLLLLVFLLLAPSAWAKPIVADLDNRKIEITSGFTGTDLLLFGAREDAGDIVLVVRGPAKSYVIRQKERQAGIWINRNQVQFNDVYSYYALASNRPLTNINNDYLLETLHIGTNNIPLIPKKKKVSDEKLAHYRQALLELKEHKRLYLTPEQYGSISFIGDTLFRTIIHFPETIPRGMYTAELYLFSDGQLTSIQSTPIKVEKMGFDAFVYDLAYQHPLFYGIIAILLALGAGWTASAIFRQR